jgi:hypothetical protein
MTNFAIINNNRVETVIIADTKEIALEVTNAEDAVETTGEPWTDWTLIDGVWTAPVEPEVTE